MKILNKMGINRMVKDTRGIAVVEMSIMLSLVLFMLFGFFECARIFWIHSSMENALVAAGRFAMINAADDTRLRDEFNANIFDLDASDFTFAITPFTEQGIHYETFNTTRMVSSMVRMIPALNHILLHAQVTVSAPAGVFECARLGTLMGTARGYLLRVQNDTEGAIRLFTLDDKGKKTLNTRVEAGKAQIFTKPIQNGQPWVVTDDSGACLEIVVPWRPTPNLIVSPSDQHS